MTTLLTTSTVPSAPSATGRSSRPRHRVPWLTVLPLALVLAYADGFWTTSLRGAVGAISRTQEPFASFWRTSTLTLPVFVLAVLAAVTYGLHRFGPEPRSARARVVTGLLVAAFATVVALGLSVGSAAYDFHLQSAQLEMMHTMANGCDTTCLGRQRWATLGAHARAIAYTGVALLLTNVVLVAWLVALRGGGLRLVSARSSARSGARRSAADSHARDVRLLLGAGLLASAVIHAAVAPEHLEEWWAAGLFFVVLTSAEVAAAALLLVPRPRTGAACAALVSAVPLAVWTVSRTAGLPFGPEAGTPEAVGLADVVACLLELGTLVAAVVLLRGRDRVLRPPLTAHHRALALVAVVAVGALGLGAAAPAWFDGVDEPVATEHAHHE